MAILRSRNRPAPTAGRQHADEDLHEAHPDEPPGPPDGGRRLTAAAMLSACGGVKTTSTGGEGKYPTGNIQMSVGASPGGSTDLITRAIAEGLGKELGVSVPVVNKPGANGALNAKELQSAKPDGYKIAVQNASLFTITPLAVSAAEAVKVDDFDLITGISQDDYVLAAPAGSGYKTIADLKKSGKNIKYGTTGVGTGAQLASALTFKVAGIPSTDVPFDGGAPAMTALLGKSGRRGHLPDRRGHRERQGRQARPAGRLLGRADQVPAGRADRQGAGLRRRRVAVPVPDGAEGDAGRREDQAGRRGEEDLRHRRVQEVQRGELPHADRGRARRGRARSSTRRTTKYKAQIDQYGIQLGAKK